MVLKRQNKTNLIIFGGLVLTTAPIYALAIDCQSLNEKLPLTHCIERNDGSHSIDFVVSPEREKTRAFMSVKAIIEASNKDLAAQQYAVKKRRLGDANIHMHHSNLEIYDQPDFFAGGLRIPLRAAQDYRMKVDLKKA